MSIHIFVGTCSCCKVETKVRVPPMSELYLCIKGWRRERQRKLSREGVDIGSFTGRKTGVSYLDPDRRVLLAREGGKKAWEKKTLYMFSDEDRARGGKASRGIKKRKPLPPFSFSQEENVTVPIFLEGEERNDSYI